MSLKNVNSDDLTARWDSIIDDYLLRLTTLKQDLIKIDKIRYELVLIREELLSRNIKVDEPPQENI